MREQHLPGHAGVGHQRLRALLPRRTGRERARLAVQRQQRRQGALGPRRPRGRDEGGAVVLDRRRDLHQRLGQRLRPQLPARGGGRADQGHGRLGGRLGLDGLARLHGERPALERARAAHPRQLGAHPGDLPLRRRGRLGAGITDASSARPELLLAQVQYQRDNGELQTGWLDFVGRFATTTATASTRRTPASISSTRAGTRSPTRCASRPTATPGTRSPRAPAPTAAPSARSPAAPTGARRATGAPRSARRLTPLQRVPKPADAGPQRARQR